MSWSAENEIRSWIWTSVRGLLDEIEENEGKFESSDYH